MWGKRSRNVSSDLQFNGSNGRDSQGVYMDISKQWQRLLWGSALSLSFFSVQTFAAIGSGAMDNYVQILGGVTFAKLGKSGATAGSQTYTAGEKSDTAGMFGVTYGDTFHHANNMDCSVGVSIYYLSDHRVKGTQDFLTPNTKYSYRVSSVPVLAMFRIGWLVDRYWTPYIAAGVGFSFNEFNKYTQDGGNSVNFANHTKASVAFEINPGVAYKVSNMASVFVSYHYLYLGKPESAAGTGGGTGRIKVGTVDMSALTTGVNLEF